MLLFFPRTMSEGERAMLRDWRQLGQRAPSPAFCAMMVWTLAYPESETKPTCKGSSFSPCLSAVLRVETQMVGRDAGGRGGARPLLMLLCCDGGLAVLSPSSTASVCHED
jgi:hypothetical protein